MLKTKLKKLPKKQEKKHLIRQKMWLNVMILMNNVKTKKKTTKKTILKKTQKITKVKVPNVVRKPRLHTSLHKKTVETV